MEAVVRVNHLVMSEVLAEGASGRAGTQRDGVPVLGVDDFHHVLAFAGLRQLIRDGQGFRAPDPIFERAGVVYASFLSYTT